MSKNCKGSSTENDHQTIRSKVQWYLACLNSDKFDIDEFEKLLLKNVESVLKPKKTSSNPHRSRSKVIFKGLRLHRNTLYSHVESLLKEKKSACWLIVIRIVVETNKIDNGKQYKNYY